MVLAAAACSSSSSALPPSPRPAPVVAQADAAAAPDADDLAPIPYTAEQIRAASPVGRVIVFRVEVPGAPPKIQVLTFVASDQQGAEIEAAERDDQGNPVGSPKRTRATWEELRRHAAFPRAATTIEDGVADTPAGQFPSKIYVVKRGDEVSRFYFAVDRPGPPVLFHTDKNGQRTMTSTLIPSADPVPAPVACKTDDDCWLDGRTPVARPKSERGKKLKPCRDGEAVPKCKDQVCTYVAYKC
jgi:hypothetical protein